MFEIVFYHRKNQKSEIEEYLDQLSQKSKKDKTNRILKTKILTYLNALSEYGTRLGSPKVKYIEDEIWELRPLNNRIFFFMWKGDKIILLHHYIKKTKKMPRREFEKAMSNRKDFLERCK